MKVIAILLVVTLTATSASARVGQLVPRDVECPPTGIEFLPAPDDCKFYYICNNGVATRRQCAIGLVFDLLTNNCNFPADSVCIKDATPPTATTDDGMEPTDPIDPEDPNGPTAPTPTQTVPTAPTPPGEDTTVPTAPTPAG